MNQILVTNKIYVTPKTRRRKKIYKVIFYLSIILVISLFSYYIYSEAERNRSEAISQQILGQINFDNTTSDDLLVVSLSEDEGTNIEEINVENMNINNITTYTSADGTEYNIDAILTIPALNISYPVLSETNEELLKISLNKYWGSNPNEVGNYCIAGHNYKNGKLFGKLNQMKNGDILELQDSTGKTIKYAVYNKYSVSPDDVSCTSQLTNGQREVTLITCINSGSQRLIVKCREVE